MKYETDAPSAKVIVKPLEDPGEWESFWAGACGGTLFNSLKFLSYHSPARFTNHHLTFWRKGNLVGILPAAERVENGLRILVSHPGASYGGPAWSRRLRYHQLENLVAELVSYGRDQGFDRIRLTPPPLIYDFHPHQALDFALMRNKFSVIRTELTQAVSLDFDETRMLDTFVNKARTAYRKAVKSDLRFRIIDKPTKAELERFWYILLENRRGLGVVPAHSRDEIELLHELVPSNLMMAVAEVGDDWAGIIWNLVCNRQVVLEFYMAHVLEYQHLRPVPFLTYHTMRWAKERGFRYLDFGISSIWSEPTWGLLKFKENFNSLHYLRQTWEVKLK